MAAQSNKPLRILLLCEHFYPHVDGCSKRMTVFEQVLSSRGHEVHVLASETSLVEADDSYQAPSNVHFFPAFEMKEKTVLNRLRNNWSEKVGSEKAAGKLGRFDYVVVTSPPLMLSISGRRIAKKAHAKLVFDVRDIWPDVAYEMGSFTEKSIYGRVFSYLAKKAYGAADLITVVSESKASKLKKQLSEKDGEKIRLVPNGLDLAFLENTEKPELVLQYNLDDDDPPCVYIGNIGLAQGLSSLLYIAENNPEIRFLLFGSGAEEALIAEEIESRSLTNVHLCGRLDVAGVYTVLKHARMAYVPLKSSKMLDSVPTKLFEALGCGCPVMLAAQGDSAEILAQSGLGISVPPEERDDLLEAFKKLKNANWTNIQKEYAMDYIVKNYSRQASGEIISKLLETSVYGS